MAKGRTETIVLRKDEVKELKAFFMNELALQQTFLAACLVAMAAVLAAAQLKFTADSRFVYALYFGFIVTLCFGSLALMKVLILVLAKYLLEKGRFSIFETGKYRHCANKTRKELAGRQYYVIHVMWYRYAIRVSQRSKGGNDEQQI